MTQRRLMIATVLLAAILPANAAAATRVTVPGAVPPWAKANRDRGAAAGGAQASVTVSLALRDEAAAQSLLQQVSDPASASYGQYLSPAQFRARFAANDADVAAVTSFLRGAGLTADDEPTYNGQVTATGTLAQIEAAFGTTVHRFAYRGRLLDAPTTDVSVPARLAGKVLAVTGLDEGGTLTRPLSDTLAPATAAPDAPVAAPARHGAAGTAPPPPGFRNAPPCSTFFGQKVATQYPPVNGQPVPFTPCGYTPAQFQGAYGTAAAIGRGLDGRGVTVAITDAYAAPTILQDANTYAIRHGQQPFADGQFTQLLPKKPYRYGYSDAVNGDLCGEQGWYGEETLDVEAVHAMAPGANVLYVGGRSCADPDLLGALRKIVNKRAADVITNSWGDIGEDTPAGTLRSYDAIFLQAALEGIGVSYSSGDDGDDSGDTDDGSAVTDFPSTSPLVTAVGGTSLAVGSANDYQFETGWATGTSTLSSDGTSWDPPFPGDFLYGGGGGVSALYREPFYQRGVVPNAIAQGHRATPDIALDGDPQTGMLIGETQTFSDGARYDEYRIGGTSLSSPLFAGVVALADQAAGRPLGFANPAIYRLAGKPAVRDVRGAPPVPAVVRVNYNNSEDASEGTTVILRSLDDEAQSLHVKPGWDTLTGLGSPNGVAFLAALGGR